MNDSRFPVFWCITIVLVLGMGLPLGAVWARKERLQIEVSPSTIVASSGTRTGRIFYRDVQQVSLVESLPEPARSFPRLIEGKPYLGDQHNTGFIGAERVAPPYLYVQGTRYFMVIRRADDAETRRLYNQIQAALIAYAAR